MTVMLVLLAGCGAAEKGSGAVGSGSPEYTEFSDLKGKRVSMLTGAPFEELVKSKEAGVQEFTYFNNNPDMLLALKAGKTDAALNNNAIAELAVNRDPGIELFPKNLKDGVFGIAFAKGSPLRDEWQKAYDKIPEETKKQLWKKWTGVDDSVKSLPEQDWPGSNGTIRAAVCDTLEPMSYAGENGKPMGFDVEMILLMAKELDMRVEFTGMEFGAILSYVESGKAEIGAGSIIVTDERRKVVDFVEYYPAAFVLMVRSTGQGVSAEEKESGFMSSIAESFEKTFILEDRWKLFMKGIGITLLITVMSIVFGTALGFAVFMLCRNGNPVANAITRFLVWLIQGMPVVVLLMILYYIIFGSLSISGTVVSIIAFTLVFGASVYGMMKNGVSAVDRGQYEAAYTLGYTNRKTFFRVILPQALPFIMPSYRNSIRELIKATAIVGYVAVQDLTKVGDLIRSRTLEAFFPLIVVAVIYFILAAVLTFCVNRISFGVDPKSRKKEKILKGVSVK